MFAGNSRRKSPYARVRTGRRCIELLIAAAAAVSVRPAAPAAAAPQPAPSRPAPALSPVERISQARVKFVTTGEGIYRVTYDTLRPYVSKMGDPRRWSLLCAGRPVPMLVVGEEDGKFDRNDYIEWFAPSIQTPYNRITHGFFDNNVTVVVQDAYTTTIAYFLHFGGANAAASPRIRDVLTTVSLVSKFWERRTFRRTRRYEYDWVRRNFMPDPGAEYTDHKFWDYFSWPSRKFRHHYIRLIGLDGNPAATCSLTVKLWGENRPRNPAVHQAQISINKTVVGRARWKGTREFYFTTTTLSPKIFKEWATEFAVEAVRRSPDQPDMMLLDWIEVSYPSIYRAENDYLDFVGPPLLKAPFPPIYNGWLNPLAIETFYRTPAWVLDVTSGERQQLPLLIKRVISDTDVYSFYLPIAKTGHRYVAYSPGSLRTPDDVRWVEPDRLRSAQHGADYLIVTHEKFRKEAERLAKHRGRLGLRPFVVTTEEIADSFHEGFANIVAVKEFIRTAYATWKPRPRFVVLVGDASWEDLGVRGGEFANYLPTYYHKSGLGYYASDNWFACVDGDDVYPDLAIGRLPVRSIDDAREYVDKVIEYDTRPAKGDWRRSALLLSSYSPYSHQQLDKIAKGVLKDFDVARCYTTPKMTRSAALATTVTKLFDAGHSVVVFAGHGGSFVWQLGGNIGGRQALEMFSPNHVARLANRRKYPLVLALTCYTNSFDNPLMQTIGESLVLNPRRGAIAVVSATWRGALEHEFPLANDVLVRLKADPMLTVGEALTATKRALKLAPNTHGVCLLGDPALRIYLDSRPDNTDSR